MAVHEQIRIKCDECSQDFAHSDGLRNHVNRIHKGIKEICQYCNKKVSYLKAHIAQYHETDKKFGCNDCEKSFSRRTSLKIHIERVHERLKNHKCDRCDKMFSDKGNMLKHIACVHDGLKPYNCEYCGKAYGQSNDLKRHIQKVHLKNI